MFQFSVLQFILGICSPYLKKVLISESNAVHLRLRLRIALPISVDVPVMKV